MRGMAFGFNPGMDDHCVPYKIKNIGLFPGRGNYNYSILIMIAIQGVIITLRYMMHYILK